MGNRIYNGWNKITGYSAGTATCSIMDSLKRARRKPVWFAENSHCNGTTATNIRDVNWETGELMSSVEIMPDERDIIELDEKLEALRQKHNAAIANGLTAKAKQIAKQMGAVQHKRKTLETFCERDGCTRKSYGYKWCEPCHVAFETFLALMDTGFVVCGHCSAGFRPGVLLFTKKCCPRCGFDLSDEEQMRRLEIASIVG